MTFVGKTARVVMTAASSIVQNAQHVAAAANFASSATAACMQREREPRRKLQFRVHRRTFEKLHKMIRGKFSPEFCSDGLNRTAPPRRNSVLPRSCAFMRLVADEVTSLGHPKVLSLNPGG